LGHFDSSILAIIATLAIGIREGAFKAGSILYTCGRLWKLCLVHIPIKAELEIKEDSKSLRKFVEVVSKALGFVGKPLQTYLQGKADASATVSAAKAEIQADDLRQFAKIRREHLELRRAENIRAVVRQAPAFG
jgi:hypothetical protein